MITAQNLLACFVQGKKQREIVNGITVEDLEDYVQRELWRILSKYTVSSPHMSLEDIRTAINDSGSKLRVEVHGLVDHLLKQHAFFIASDIELMQERTAQRAMRELGSRLATTGTHYTLADATADVGRAWDVLKSGRVKEPVRNADQIARDAVKIAPEAQGIKITTPELRACFGDELLRRLYIVAGRPSMGKNIFTDRLVALDLAQRERGIYVSWDNDDNETALKLKCHALNLNYGAMRKRMYGEEQISRVYHHTFKYAPIITHRTMTAYQLRVYVEAIKANYPDTGWLVIDYFQNIKRADLRENIVTAYEAAVLEIKRIATDLKIAVILLSQVGRGVESQGNGEVGLHDLKWCSALEQEAYYVIGIGGQRNTQKRKVSILKNKDGALDDIDYTINFGINSIHFEGDGNPSLDTAHDGRE